MTSHNQDSPQKSTTTTTNTKKEEQDKKEAEQPEKEMEWKGASLGSVPFSIISFCLWKAEQSRQLQLQQQQQQKTSSSSSSSKTQNTTTTIIPSNVTVHLSKGEYRYRAQNLASIDSAMNVRLENVTVSKIKRFGKKKMQRLEQKSQKQGGNQQRDLLVLQRQQQQNLLLRQQQQQPNRNQNQQQDTNSIVPLGEKRVQTMKSTLLSGSSIMMMELPESWTPLFDQQAVEVKKEVFRRKNKKSADRRKERKARNKLRSEKRKQKKKSSKAKK